MVLHTIGYERRRPTGLVETLKVAQVTMVIDVRQSAASRLPEWSAQELSHALAVAGIAYQHRAGLGNPYFTHGQRVTKEDGAAILDQYQHHLRTSTVARAGLESLVTRLREQPEERICLLCWCRARSKCHRGVIVDELHKRLPSLQVVDL